MTSSHPSKDSFDIEVSGNDFVLLEKVDAPELWVEGMSKIQIGPVLSKLILHSVFTPKTSKNQPEVRKTVATLVIPTNALIEISKQILAISKLSEPKLAAAVDQYSIQIKQNLASTPTIALAAGAIEENQ